MMTCGMCCLDSYLVIVVESKTGPESNVALESNVAFECRLDMAQEARKLRVSLCRCKSCLSSLFTPCC